MKLTDATWEKRNLFLETKEITVEPHDTLEDLDIALSNANEEYIVVKLPSGRTGESFLLSKYGYTYVETMTDLEVMTPDIPPLSFEKQKIFDQVTVIPMSPEQRKGALLWVGSGLFQTDRISLDPYFNLDLSSRRYIGWLCDEVNHGAEFWQLEMGHQPIGFFAVKEEAKDTYNGFLSSIYTPHQGKGYAFLGAYKYPAVYIPRGAKCFVSQISTNNLKALRRSLSGGNKIVGLTNIFVKHNLPHEEYLKRIEPHKDTLISEALSWIE